jgi:hypothetical protein
MLCWGEGDTFRERGGVGLLQRRWRLKSECLTGKKDIDFLRYQGVTSLTTDTNVGRHKNDALNTLYITHHSYVCLHWNLWLEMLRPDN